MTQPAATITTTVEGVESERTAVLRADSVQGHSTDNACGLSLGAGAGASGDDGKGSRVNVPTNSGSGDPLLGVGLRLLLLDLAPRVYESVDGGAVLCSRVVNCNRETIGTVGR